jgi:predicted RNA-binding Zn ribbon-like protein
VHHRVPAAADIAALNIFVSELYRGVTLVPSPSGLVLETRREEGFDSVLSSVVRAAVELLTSLDHERIGKCADDSCAWLFLDTTRSGTRRWCDMKSCGNRNKIRRFRHS